jgi:predicted ATP-grasp superfamily ATP-dependent carboligase
MDFLLGRQGPLALEINPRLSASFELYEIPDLLDRHLQACLGQLTPLPECSPGAKASLIHYASHDFDVPEQVDWPDWAVDRPAAGSRILAGEPVCSVLARAENAMQAKTLVFARAREIDAQCRPLKT